MLAIIILISRCYILAWMKCWGNRDIGVLVNTLVISDHMEVLAERCVSTSVCSCMRVVIMFALRDSTYDSVLLLRRPVSQIFHAPFAGDRDRGTMAISKYQESARAPAAP